MGQGRSLAAAAYNFFPCQTVGESPFVLMFSRDPIIPFAKLLEPAPRYWGDHGGHLKMNLLKKLYLLTAENVKRARERRDPKGDTKQENTFKVNDLVLVRDVTSGAFAPRYMPNYRIIQIHGPNRIVVRDKKGVESVRRSSHLKVCEPKDKVTAALPETNEYEQFGRNTKLLLYPRDVPDLEFSSKMEKKGEISPEIEISSVNIITNREATSSPRFMRKRVEISPQKPVKAQFIRVYDESVVGCKENVKKHGEISPEGSLCEDNENADKNKTWFQNPVNCVSKWSKTLRRGVIYSMGLDVDHTASVNQRENDKHNFSFFL